MSLPKNASFPKMGGPSNPNATIGGMPQMNPYATQGPQGGDMLSFIQFLNQQLGGMNQSFPQGLPPQVPQPTIGGGRMPTRPIQAPLPPQRPSMRPAPSLGPQYPSQFPPPGKGVMINDKGSARMGGPSGGFFQVGPRGPIKGSGGFGAQQQSRTLLTPPFQGNPYSGGSQNPYQQERVTPDR